MTNSGARVEQNGASKRTQQGDGDMKDGSHAENSGTPT